VRRQKPQAVSWGFFIFAWMLLAWKGSSIILRSTTSITIVLFTAAFFPTAGKSNEKQNKALPVAEAFREVRDETGRTVRIPQMVRRIVSLSPNQTEIVYALGVQDRLVGDSDYCDYPPDAQKKIKVGGTISPSIEQIASLHPDLVLVTKINRLETVQSLAELGIPSYAIDPHTVDEIIASSLKLADLLGAPDAGAALAGSIHKRLDDLQRRVGSLTPKRVLFVVWNQPLISVGKDTFIADALRHAGALSVVETQQNWPQVSLEEVVRLQPDYLIGASSHSENTSSELESLAALSGWNLLDAVTHRRFAVVSDAINRPSPRIVSAIEDLARQLHPEAFADPSDPSKQKLMGQTHSPVLGTKIRFRPESVHATVDASTPHSSVLAACGHSLCGHGDCAEVWSRACFSLRAWSRPLARADWAK
jgi:iron complex transport system substrate-binding protein